MVACAFLVDVAVVIPSSVTGHDKSGPGIGADQVARENQRVADRAPAIALLLLIGNSHYFRHARVIHNRPRATIVLVIVGEGAVRMAAAAQGLIELLESFPAAFERLFHSFLRRQIRRAIADR